MRFYIIIFACLLASVSFAAAKASARAFFSPSIETTGQYNDNIYYSSTDRENDFIVNATPAMDIKLSTERFSLSAAPKYSYLRYMDNIALSRSIEDYNVDATSLFSQRFSLKTTAEYKKDSTQESELNETGVVNALAERYKFFWEGAAVFNISERSVLSLGYNHTSMSYEWGGNADRKNDGLSLTVKRMLNDEKSEISLVFSSSTTVSEASSTTTASTQIPIIDLITGETGILTSNSVSDLKQRNQTRNYGASINFSKNINEKTKLVAGLGARRTINVQHLKINTHIENKRETQSGTSYSVIDTSADNDESSNRWGGVFNFDLTYDMKKYYAKVGYSRDMTHDSSGDPIERDRFHFNTRKNTSERAALYFSASLAQTRSESGDIKAKNTYYYITPGLIYKLTKDATANLWYQYSYSKNSIDDGGWVGARNLVCFTCSFNFPKQM